MANVIGSAWVQIRPEFLNFGDEVAKGVGEVGAKASESFGKKFGAGLMAAGGAATAVGGLLVKVAEPLESANARLDNAIKNTGKDAADFGKGIEDTVKHMENFGHTADDTKNALAKLTEVTGDPAKAIKDMGVVADLAADKHISLADAANTVGRVLGGNTRALKEYGITLTDVKAATTSLATAHADVTKTADTLAAAQKRLADLEAVDAGKKKLTIADHIALANAQDAVTKATQAHNTALANVQSAQLNFNAATKGGTDALTLLENKIKGGADAQAQTFGGHIAALRAHFIDMAAELGAKVGPALSLIGPPLLGIGAAIQSGIIGKVAGVVTGFGSMIASAASWAAATIASVTETIAIWALYAAEAVAKAAAAAASWVAGLATQIAETAVWAASMIASAAVAVAGWVASMAVMVASAVAAGIAMILPFLPVILILAAIAAAAYLLYANWDTVWSAIKAVTSAVTDVLKRIFLDLVNVYMLPIRLEIAALRAVWEAVWPVIQAVVQTAWAIVQPIFGFIVNLGIHLVRDEIKGLQAIWQGVWTAVTGAVQDAWAVIKGIFDLIKGAVKDVIDTIGSIGKAISNIPGAGAIKGAVGAVGSVLGFAEGGRVPGPAGAPMVAVVHGGEWVQSRDDQQYGRAAPGTGGRGGSGGSVSVVQHIYPAAGQDEYQIGQTAAREVAWSARSVMR